MKTAPAPSGAQEALWRRIVAPPSTRLGRSSAWLVGGVFALLAVVGAFVLAGATELGWGARLALVLATATGVVTAIAGGGAAAVALFRGERSITVLGPLVFGAVCLQVVLGLVGAVT